MTPRPPAPCHHELRPGTSVCLHCRRAAREATAARHRAILVRLGLCAAAIGAVAFAGFSGLAAWKNPEGSDLGRLIATPGSLEAASLAAAPSPSAAQPAATASAPASSAASADTTAARNIAAADSAKLSVTAPASVALPALAPAAQVPVSPPAVTSPPANASLHPIVGEGRTELADGMYALRSGDTVTVHFDTPEARTRRPEKFEQIVRATLPQIHGRAAESMLAGIAGGNLLPPGEIGAPLQPISLRGANGQALSVSPQTRAGRDGPLVVAYRVTPAR